MKKILSSLILFTFLFTQICSVVFAEENVPVEGTSQSIDTSVSSPVVIPSEETLPSDTSGLGTLSNQGSDIVLGDANLENVNVVSNDVQSSVSGTLIQDTVNTQLPQESIDQDLGSSIEIVLPSGAGEDGNSTTGDLIPLEETDAQAEISLPAEEVTTEIVKDTEVEPVLEEDFIVFKKPKPVYSFSVSSRKVNTKKKEIKKEMRMNFKNSKKGVSELVDVATEVAVSDFVTPVVNEEKGTMDISGACSNTYYVVLLYKTEQDYTENPNSYVYNKAFNCINNNYSYSIGDLPEKLENGPYYLLIGEQGDRGTWTPSTGLTEININRN